MADRPIIFSAPMVRALLEGRKTQTRRVLRDVPAEPAANCNPAHRQLHPAPYLDAYCSAKKTPENPRGMSETWCWWQVDDRQCLPTFRVRYTPGDQLWVRERASWPRVWDEDPARVHIGRVFYEAPAPFPSSEIKAPEEGHGRLKAAMHLPRSLSRLTLTVTDVRVQRLQDISAGDAISEGVAYPPEGMTRDEAVEYDVNPIGTFRQIWGTLHGQAHGWTTNPWVVALTFTVARRNIDAWPAA